MAQLWPADQVERWPIERLIPYARNAREHSDAQVAQIAASIKEWGWTVPVLADEEGGLIAGHGRVLAARKLSLPDVPVMVARGWSEAQKRAYIIADNKLAENASWNTELLALELGELQGLDFDLELTGLGETELAGVLAVDTADPNDPEAEWKGMPEFQQPDNSAFKTVVVHFPNQSSVSKFEQAVGQNIAGKSMWFPPRRYETPSQREFVSGDGDGSSVSDLHPI